RPASPFTGAALHGQQLGQASSGPCLEHRVRWKPHSKCFADPEDDIDGQDGVAAEFEEVVVDADAVQAEDVGPDPGNDPFRIGTRGHVVTIRRGAPRRGGQGAAVEFAVGGQRQGLQGGVGGGDHVVGQGGGQVGAQAGGGRDGGGGVGGDEVGGQLPAAGGVFAGDDGGVRDGGVSEQGGLYFAGFDAEAADLDLLIGAAGEFELAAGAPAGQVAGGVHAVTGRPERAGDEPRGGQAGLVQVAAGQPGPGDVQLPRYAGRHRPQPRIQHVNTGVVQRRADRHQVGHGARRGHGVAGGERGGLGRPVPVHDGQGGAGGQHP